MEKDWSGNFDATLYKITVKAQVLESDEYRFKSYTDLNPSHLRALLQRKTPESNYLGLKPHSDISSIITKSSLISLCCSVLTCLVRKQCSSVRTISIKVKYVNGQFL
jgi:hypothetical protein